MAPPKIEEFLRTRSDELRLPFPEPDTDLFQNGLLDSFALVSLISVIEEELGVEITDSEVNEDRLSTLSSIEGYLDDLKRKA